MAIAHLAFQFAAILLATKIAGEICDPWLKVPSVIGELLAGVAFGTSPSDNSTQ